MSTTDTGRAAIEAAAVGALSSIITPGVVARALESAAADAGIPVEVAFARAVRWARGG